MKTFFKYCLFIFALAFSQLSLASTDNCPTVNGRPMANCVDPTCNAGESTYGLDYRKCIPPCRSGYSSTSSADLVCMENCRTDYHPTGAVNCTRDGSLSYVPKTSCSYYKGTRVIKKCGTEGCRDGYDNVAGVCWAHVYQKGSYTRTNEIHYARNCPAGYTLKETQPAGFYYYCQLCNSDPTTSTVLSIDGGTYYKLGTTVTLKSTVNITVPLCNSTNGTITTSFTGNNGTATKSLGSCTLQKDGKNATGGDVGEFTCTVQYRTDTAGDWVVSGDSVSSLGGQAKKLASPSNNGNLSFTVVP